LKRCSMSLFTRQRLVILFATAAVIAAPGVSYAQFGGKNLLGAAANAAKGKAAEALTDGAMKELDKKFTDMVAKEPISDAAKAGIVKKLSEMAKPIVKRIVDGAMSGSLPNPAELVKTVLGEVMPRVPELVAAAKAGDGGGTVAAAATAPQPAPAAEPQAPPAEVAAHQTAAEPQPAPQAAPPHQAAPPKKPMIAVYAFGADDPALNKAMITRLIIALDNNGRYQATENYKEFFEHAAEMQKGGAATVNSKQYKKLGEQFGAEYVCVAEITTVFGDKQVSAHVLKAGSHGIVAIGAADIPLKTLTDLTAAAEQIVEAMFKNLPRADNFGALGDARDGKTYKTVNIGGKTWMAENLNHKTQNGSWCYQGSDESNCDKYGGRLYNWNTAKSVCPAGWRLPSRQEWADMIAKTGGSSAAGKKLKAASGWSSGGNGINGTDDYGFSALPGGYRANNGGFGNAGSGGNWWTDTENGAQYGYALRMSSYDDSVDETYNYKEYGFSVRCIQD